MAIAEDRMSTTVVEDLWQSPDDRSHSWIQDFEAGPIARSDTSAGLYYQPWELNWDSLTGNFVVTPEITGVGSTVITVAGVTQCSFAFDQNGRVTIAYTAAGAAYLYWYDTDRAGFFTDPLDLATVSPMLSLDDKRSTQTNTSDILLWYTRQQPDNSWNLYKREQRERFLIEDLMVVGTFPYCYKAGMHKSLRGQVALRATL
jgi:hypothetical protein